MKVSLDISPWLTSRFFPSVPVLPVVLSVSLCALAVILILIIYLTWRRRQDKKYKHYTEIAKTAVKPPTFTVHRTQHLLAPQQRPGHPGTYGIRPEKPFSSDESVSPLSSEHEDTYFDALDKGDGGRSRESMSSREPSPASAFEEDEDASEEEDYDEGNLGRVWFNLEYDKKGESLSACIVKARNLSTCGREVKANDPFIKLQILPDRKHISQQTTHKRKTNRPNFNETFYFHMPVIELDRSTLQLTVSNGYRASQQSTIGQVSFPLIEMDMEKKMELWRDLEQPVEVS